MRRDFRPSGGLLACIAIAAGPIYLGSLTPGPPAASTAEAAGQVAGGEGEALYLQSCAACHGPGGAGTADGPPLVGVGAASADFVLRTGRMPLSAPDAPAGLGADWLEAVMREADATTATERE